MKEIEKITSRDNVRLVNVRKVRDGKVRGQIFIEGRRLVDEALLSSLVIDECYVSESFADREMLEAVAKRSVSITEVPERLFSSLADTIQPQGIVVLAKRPADGKSRIENSVAAKGRPTILFLHEINNPSNLGAVLRTAEAAGVAGVIISQNSTDVYSPKALRAAMGASFRLAVWEEVGLDETLLWAESNKLSTTATAASAAMDYTQVNWKIPRLLIFGSEAHGLSEQTLSKVDETIRIPLANNVESLNLAVSAGIILFEAKRQFA